MNILPCSSSSLTYTLHTTTHYLHLYPTLPSPPLLHRSLPDNSSFLCTLHNPYSHPIIPTSPCTILQPTLALLLKLPPPASPPPTLSHSPIHYLYHYLPSPGALCGRLRVREAESLRPIPSHGVTVSGAYQSSSGTAEGRQSGQNRCVRGESVYEGRGEEEGVWKCVRGRGGTRRRVRVYVCVCLCIYMCDCG